MDNSWIKIHRQIESWDWYQDSNTKSLFLHLLIRANFKDGSWRGIPVKRGQVITGRKKLSVQLGLSEQNVRTSMDKLKLTNEVTSKSTNEYSLITINNYEEYQVGNQQANQDLTKEQPTSNQGLTTIEERKKDKKEKKERKNTKIKFLEFVFLTKEEKEKLRKDFGLRKFSACLLKLDNFIPNSKAAKSYKDHNRVLRGWVSEWYDEEHGKKGSAGRLVISEAREKQEAEDKADREKFENMTPEEKEERRKRLVEIRKRFKPKSFPQPQT